MELPPHPQSLWSPWRVTCEVSEAAGGIDLRFRIAGDLAVLVVPPVAPAVRTDELWRTTCFELFVAEAAGDRYVEFNLSPSGAWAAYRFDRYREGMIAIGLDDDPRIDWSIDAGEARLRAVIPWPTDAVRFNCSAVLEHTDGRRAYFALAHAPGKPDFHAPACFVGRLGGKDAG